MRGHLLDHLEELALGTPRQTGDALVGHEQQEGADVVEPLAVPHRSPEIQTLHSLAEPIEPGYLSGTPDGDVVMRWHHRVLLRTVAVLVAAASLRVVPAKGKPYHQN